MSGLDLTGDLARRRRGGRVVVVVLLLVAGAAAGTWWYLSQPPLPDEAAAALAAAWTGGDPGDGPVVDPTSVRDAWTELRENLGNAPLSIDLAAVATDESDGALATATYALAWTLPGDRTWAYETTAQMRLADDGWLVEFAPQVMHPDLVDGASLRLRRTTATRADVFAEDGTALVTARPVVDVGIQPSRVEDTDDTVAAVRDALDLDLDGLGDRIDAADPDQFVPVVTLREDDYDDIADELQPIPGTVFRPGEQVLAPTRTFARATLGQAGPVTAELLEQEPERYAAGDVVGLSGLQRVYDERLGGRPGLEVVEIPADDRGDDPLVLFTAEAEAGSPVTVSLDLDVQRAADAALADQDEFPSALVAVRVSDGHVLAVANGPASGGLDLALTGQYAPGSTFKVVTTAALLDDGLDPDATVPCPPTATVDGRDFRNAEGGALGDVPFREAFAESCNTAFVESSRDLGPTDLRDMATRFGIGADPRLGVAATFGEVPGTEPGTDLAASAIGQGRIVLSPLAVADMAATAARGRALAPSLVLDPAPDDPADEPEPLPDAVTAALADLMRAVVTEGSGSALDDVPGEPVHAKTGTAEYGAGSPPGTHAWITGWQGDLAFAVIVAETPDAFGGQVAAPIAADFLSRLADD